MHNELSTIFAISFKLSKLVILITQFSIYNNVSLNLSKTHLRKKKIKATWKFHILCGMVGARKLYV